MSDAERDEALQSVYLTSTEIAELLEHVKVTYRHEFVFPMFAFAAYTGARRSEIIASRIDDVDFKQSKIVIHEKKRVPGAYSTRVIPLSNTLSGVLEKWLAIHPGGPNLFVISHQNVSRSSKRHLGTAALSFEEATHHFNQAIKNSKWERLKGWHVFRHSFCSNCASAGVDQRLIDEWVGHQTEEMRQRYRHLIPSKQKTELERAFR